MSELSPGLGIAILGAAHMHAGGVGDYIRQRPGLALRWVYDGHLARAEALATPSGAEATTELDRVLEDPNVHAVMVFSETDQHDWLIGAALACGKHLYVDKPLAISADRAWTLAEKIAAASTLFSSGFVLRRRAHHQFLRQQIQAGALGRITRVRHCNGHAGVLRGHFDNPLRQWFTDPQQSAGGGFLDEGTHSADMVMWLLGRRPQRVTAAVSNITGRYPGCEEFGQGLMTFDDGAIATISGSWVDPAKATTLEISGTEGSATVVADRDLYMTTPHLPGADGRTAWKDLPPGLAHPQAIFLDALLGETRGELVAVEEAAAAAAVMCTMIQAAAQQRWLDVPLAAVATASRGAKG